MSSGVGESDVAGFQIQFCFLQRSENARTIFVEFFFPARNDHCCEAIANDIYAGATHVHQFIHAENNRHTDRPQP